MKTIITINIDGTEGLISEENSTGMKFKVPEDSPHREETIATSLLDYLLYEKSESIEEPIATFDIGDTVYVKSAGKVGRIDGVISNWLSKKPIKYYIISEGRAIVATPDDVERGKDEQCAKVEKSSRAERRTE